MGVDAAVAALPELAVTPGRPFGIYVHVPFCAVRCGYCDFNTYTPAELGGANPDGWLSALRTELRLAAAHLGEPPDVQTVFVGGGTPSLLGAAGLTAVLDAIRDDFTLVPGAEEKMVQPGGELRFTQAPVNLVQMIGKFIFNSAEAQSGQGQGAGGANVPKNLPSPAK